MKLILGLALLVLIAIMIGYSSMGPSEPTEFVSNKTYSNFSNLFYTYEILRYPSNVEIMDIGNLKENVTLGFVTDPWNINFGVIPGNGTYVMRNIEFTNKKEGQSKVYLTAYGNISPHIYFSQSTLTLETGEKASVDIYMFSNNTEPGNYSGEVDVIVKKAIYNFFPIL